MAYFLLLSGLTVFVVGIVLALVPRGADVREVDQIAGSDSALGTALDAANRADNLLQTEPGSAMEYYREAWTEIERARATADGLGLPESLAEKLLLQHSARSSKSVQKLVAFVDIENRSAWLHVICGDQTGHPGRSHDDVCVPTD